MNPDEESCCSMFACRTNEKDAYGPVTLHEIKGAEIKIIQSLQRKTCSEETQYLSGRKSLKSNSRLVSLDPFVPNDGLSELVARLEEFPY